MDSADISQITDYREKMAEIYSQRKLRNKSYSLAAFARDLGIGASMLSRIMAKKRNLSWLMAQKIVRRMGISEKESSFFLQSVKELSGKGESVLHEVSETHIATSLPQNIDVTAFDFQVSWRHAALRELVGTMSFEDTPAYLSSKLSIPESEAVEVLNECVRAGFIAKSGSKYSASKHIIWGDRGPNETLRRLHKDLIGKAIEKIDGPMSQRTLSAALVTVSEAQHAELKRLVNGFITEVVQTIKKEDTDTKDRVVCINTQIYQL